MNPSADERDLIALRLVNGIGPRLTAALIDRFGSASAVLRASAAELLSAVQGEDRAVFISSHGITDLERFADHVGMIKDGRMLFEGPTVDVVERYRLVDLSAGSELDIVVATDSGTIIGVVTEQRAIPVRTAAPLPRFVG